MFYCGSLFGKMPVYSTLTAMLTSLFYLQHVLNQIFSNHFTLVFNDLLYDDITIEKRYPPYLCHLGLYKPQDLRNASISKKSSISIAKKTDCALNDTHQLVLAAPKTPRI